MKTIVLENENLCVIEGRSEVNPLNDAVLWAYVETLPQVPAGSKLWLERVEETPPEGGNARVAVVRLTQEEVTQQVAAERAERLRQTDRETQAAIAAGFTYDGHTFSLSQAAQLNWQRLLGLHQSNLFGAQTISTKDDGTYTLTAASLSAFIQAQQAAIEAALQAGRVKKERLNGA